MSDPTKTKHSIIATNRAVKQIQQHLNSSEHMQHLNSSEHQQHPGYQSQTSFERQLGLSSGTNNISALCESGPGDRRSFPRVSSGSSSKNAFALETIRRELQRVQNGTIPQQVIPSNTNNGSMQKENFKSNSFTDLRQGYRDAASSVDQQYYDLIMSLPHGFDEGVVIDTLRSYPNHTLDNIIEILRNNPNARKNKPPSNGNHRSGQAQRFGPLPPRVINSANIGHSSLPRSSHGNMGMSNQSASLQSNSHGNSQPLNIYNQVNPVYKRTHETYGGLSAHQLYDTSRQYPSNNERLPLSTDQHPQYQHMSHFTEHRPHTNMYPPSDLKGNDSSQQNSSTEIIPWKPPRNMEQSANSLRSSNMYDPSNQKDNVTLRKKPVLDRTSNNNTQNRWSAEVMVKPQYDYEKRNSMEVFPNRPPPPPYPGPTKTTLHRISSQEGEFQTNKNTPITVIFDEKNNFVNVVPGIPEEFDDGPSSPSSGQSSPRSLQKDPPPYELAATHQNPKNYNQQTSGSNNIGQLHQHSHPQPSTMHQQSVQDLPTVPPQLQQQQLNHQTQNQRPAPIQVPQQPQQLYALPHQLQQSDSTFVPIGESRSTSKDRGSPPPYPGATSSTSSLHKNSNRSSLNIDELEGTVSGNVSVSSFGSSNYNYPPAYLMSESGTSSKKTSTATEPGSFQSDSSASTSPTPDGVERSYSPLPLSSPCCDTMVIHSNNKKEGTQSNNADNEPFPTRLKNYTPQAYKFYMEQHVENLMKLQEQRKIRRQQLEAEMRRVGLASQAQEEMRKLLNQKESNYIRLRRAKMDKTMFTKIKVVGVGAFGEVSLVRKNGTSAYYAMKTLRKSEVLRRNQVAHVKAERDILAEADNEWVVKLYYSFQDEQNLYFVMDYIPGGDLMALLIKFQIFEEGLARFYISELVLAIESVHKLGFIHRDIKPDNILIDKNGHIKLTDFGLCTGFRWTHDSKYYQPEPVGGGHSRQFSMEPEGGWESLLNDVNCNCKSQRMQFDLLKPLQRRKLRRHMRCQAHSLVGTPNYIAPEVLMRIPYSQQCDWWSVGVIMYEMLIGQPPFFAQSPAETQHKVINWRHILRIPKHHNLPKESENLILRLCAAPEDRIGKDGSDEIKKHPYFSGVNFSAVHQEPAPYIPTIRNATDTSNFDPVPEGMCESDDEEADNSTKKEGPEYAFYEFTFRHFFDDGGLVNPHPEFEVSEQEEPKQASKRPARDETNYSNPVPPNKVPAQSNSTSDEKTPIYV